MARLLSCAFTERPVVDRVKTVTRRRGWTFLKPGDRLTLCRKVMGRRPGEPLVRIAEVQVVSVRRERLGDITADEVAREGFPGMTPEEFVDRFFVTAQRIRPDDLVTRIEWVYIDDPADPATGTTARRPAHPGAVDRRGRGALTGGR